MNYDVNQRWLRRKWEYRIVWTSIRRGYFQFGSKPRSHKQDELSSITNTASNIVSLLMPADNPQLENLNMHNSTTTCHVSRQTQYLWECFWTCCNFNFHYTFIMPEERLCITARDTFGLSPTKTTRGGLTDVRKSKATPVIKMIYTQYTVAYRSLKRPYIPSIFSW